MQDVLVKRPAMQHYVRSGGRSGSPQLAQPTTSRAVNGANSKVSVKRTTLSHNDPNQQQNVSRRQSGSSVNHPVAQQQNTQRRRSGEAQAGRNDRYDTDAESLDTTTHRSIVQVEDSQRPDLKQEFQEDYEGYDSEESGEHSESEGEEENFNENDHIQQPRPDRFYTEEALAKLYNGPGNFLDDGNSYPSTTSGPGDDLVNDPTADQQQLFDGYLPESRSSPSPHKGAVGNKYGRGNVQDANQRPASTFRPQHAIPNRSRLFNEGAAIRQDQRSRANLPVHRATSRQSNAPLIPTSELPSYSQSTGGQFAPAETNPRQHIPAQQESFPQHSTGQPSGPSRDQPPRPAAPVTLLAPSQLGQDRVSNEPIPTASPGLPETNPIGDYDHPALFNMSYDQLKKEDFDTVPRGKPVVLPDDMAQRPLSDRLEHVQKSLDAADQDKFFRSLQTHEWEDAGDWFLDQFSNIIQRAKEARQKKRKLATEFEAEIEKRYQQVAKRQQHVQDALARMKTQGQGLIPKSPRASKSPRKA